jgi:hypothetical protein
MSGTTYEKLFVKIAQYLSVSNQQFFVPTKSRFDIDIAKFHRNKFSGVNKCNAFILSWYNNKYTMTCDFIAEPDSSKFMLYLRKRSKGGFNLIPLLLKYRDSITKQIVVKKILDIKGNSQVTNFSRVLSKFYKETCNKHHYWKKNYGLTATSTYSVGDCVIFRKDSRSYHQMRNINGYIMAVNNKSKKYTIMADKDVYVVSFSKVMGLISAEQCKQYKQIHKGLKNTGVMYNIGDKVDYFKNKKRLTGIVTRVMPKTIRIDDKVNVRITSIFKKYNSSKQDNLEWIGKSSKLDKQAYLDWAESQ